MAILARNRRACQCARIDPLPLAKLGCVLALRALNFSRHNARRDCPDDAVGDLVLYRENIFERAVVAVCPDMVAGGRVDQLRGNAHAIAGLAHAAFEHVAHAELAADLPHVDVALVGEGRVAGDDEQPARIGQRVMMSSAMPSAKNSCSVSPLMFWNGEYGDRGLVGQGKRPR